MRGRKAGAIGWVGIGVDWFKFVPIPLGRQRSRFLSMGALTPRCLLSSHTRGSCQVIARYPDAGLEGLGGGGATGLIIARILLGRQTSRFLAMEGSNFTVYFVPQTIQALTLHSMPSGS